MLAHRWLMLHLLPCGMGGNVVYVTACCVEGVSATVSGGLTAYVFGSWTAVVALICAGSTFVSLLAVWVVRSGKSVMGACALALLPNKYQMPNPIIPNVIKLPVFILW